jgi:hypothetical protein
MPNGKPAGVRCVQLTPDNRCAIYNHADRPAVCASLRADEDMCGQNAEEAYARLVELERITSPVPVQWAGAPFNPFQQQGQR